MPVGGEQTLHIAIAAGLVLCLLVGLGAAAVFVDRFSSKDDKSLTIPIFN